MKTRLILGAGTGGTLLANKLARRLDPREWQIVVVDHEPSHLSAATSRQRKLRG